MSEATIAQAVRASEPLLTRTPYCTDCQCRLAEGPWAPVWCPLCGENHPRTLAAAARTPGAYILGLRTGQVVRFASALIRRRWALLDAPPRQAGLYAPPGLTVDDEALVAGDGLEVRLEDVAWCGCLVTEPAPPDVAAAMLEAAGFEA